jgi:hypothetical protein
MSSRYLAAGASQKLLADLGFRRSRGQAESCNIRVAIPFLAMSSIPGTRNASCWPIQMNPLICPMESGLRLKVFSSTQRRHFFAHLKRAEQIHFANKFAEPDKCRVTSIHPPGVGRVRPKHDVIMYADDAFRLRRRLAKLQRKILITGKIV